ncbi:MAG: DUF4159 domain-containing protein [Phycisphaerae bacterium]|nr:DUF4159 domain-containing protein [Phycisphaerae bacterium]
MRMKVANAVICLALTLVPSLPPRAAADVTSVQVQTALRKGVAAIKTRQGADGMWPEMGTAGGYTCLATLALLEAGESPNSAPVASGLLIVSRLPDQRTYIVGLKCMVLSAAGLDKYRSQLEAAAQWLLDARIPNGLWGYGPGNLGTAFDHSNTQFAMLGLHAAASAGFEVPRGTWRETRDMVLDTQQKDGGWTYRGEGRSYGSMTAANISNLLIVGEQVDVRSGRSYRNGVVAGCGHYSDSRPLAAGLAWLDEHFQADDNPRGNHDWLYYWLLAVERTGMLSGQRYFGRHDWYSEGAEFLVRTQQANGTWPGEFYNTCFAVLFLAKAHKPLAIQKLCWSDDQRWNLDRHDVAHLVAFIDDRLGQPVAAQAVPFDAPLHEWLAAPILYFEGHEFPKWSPAQRQKLRAYVEQGGTLLVDACCRRKSFIDGFREFAADVFPEYPLHELGSDHALYHLEYDVPPMELEGIDVGCRTAVIFSPVNLSALWEIGDVPKLSEQALHLGTNIAAYAVGRRPLHDRLDLVLLPSAQAEDPGPPPGDVLRLTQIVYDGDWRPYPLSPVDFAEFLRDEVGLDVVTQYRQLRLTDDDLASCPILYMTGCSGFDLSAEERGALVGHLRRGGFMFAEACCGWESFDESLRVLVASVFPDATWSRLPADHPIIRGSPGFELGTVRYNAAALRAEPGLSEPVLWGLEIDGRLALVYSPYALLCGSGDQSAFGCRGVEAEDARRLAANIVLYALTH